MKTKSIIVGIIVVALGAAASAFFLLHHTPGSPTMHTAKTSGGINYSPPTAQDKADSDAHKQSISQTQSTSPTPGTNTSSNPPANKTQVTPFITTYTQNSNNLAVNGFVQGVVENGGTCTLTLVRNGKTVTQSRLAVSSATNTSCGQTDVPLSSLVPGTWQATLSYSSQTAQGTSTEKDITVQ